MNESALREKIVSRGMTVETFCGRHGFSAAVFRQKMKGSPEFTRSEMERIAVALELTAEDIRDIFFA